VEDLLLYPIPGKYLVDTPVDVSIIVPLYKSRTVVQEQILRWPYEPNVNTEVVYVDDRCPVRSYQAVLDAWGRRKDARHRVKLVLNAENRGFGGACNTGAYHAKGKYLIFLNADTTVTPNWISPMVKLMQDPSVGIVGNLQIKENGRLHGTIDSAGSEWSWEWMNFMHIGRHIYHGEILDKPFHFLAAPKDLFEVQEREMVTGCCYGIRKSLFEEIGGFHIGYQKGYWEDSEMCMAVRSLGYKVMYQPNSVIFHKLAHSGAAKFADDNAVRFLNKWINSGRLDGLVKAKRLVPNTKVGKILVQRGAAHGDVLVAGAIAPALKKQYPGAKVYYATKCPEVLEDNPWIDGVLDHTTSGSPFQLIIDLDYAYERLPAKNILDAYAAEALVNTSDSQLFVKQELPECELPEHFVVVHAGRTNWVGRNWKASGFDSIARRIRKTGFKVVCIGSSADYLVDCDLDLRGETTIHQLAGVIAKAKMFVGIDSLPMHLTQAVGTPGVVYFGCIRPETRILRDNITPVVATDCICLGCHHRKLTPAVDNSRCLTGTLACESVTIDQIWQEVEGKLWNKNV
jgi:GT2 family glycosyltransferase/ADP-heptose:LPS heptosyltransferase